MGRGEKSLLSDLGPELRLGREKAKRESEEIIDGDEKKNPSTTTTATNAIYMLRRRTAATGTVMICGYR